MAFPILIEIYLVVNTLAALNLRMLLHIIRQKRGGIYMAREIPRPEHEIVGKLERFDEADNVMARGELEPDSELWSQYYKRHPELENQGRGLAKLPRMGHTSPIQDMPMFGSLLLTNTLLGTENAVDGQPSPKKITMSPERASEKLKGYARHIGADLVRIGPLDKA